MKYTMASATHLSTLVSTAVANSIKFFPLDKQEHVICSYSNLGFGTFDGVAVELPQGWVGMFNTAPLTAESCGGAAVWGEADFQSFEGKTYYEVSTLKSNNNTGIHKIFPTSQGIVAGSSEFPCPRKPPVGESLL
ncbi:hypothetical protein BDZ45DRAFT_754309 [Acephala macrosclerotiorum]|nr:hypothetical protein BDZ45DRAFT_754309 [Acephala macrosclerotiorum]